VSGRLAPSPTGELHLGGASTFLVAWLEARSRGVPLLLRVEDLDAARVAPHAEARILDDLAWLGLAWDGAPARQSTRGAAYEAALAALDAAGLVYPCDCSRAEVARIASAPHEGDEVRYPGTCRDKPRDRAFRRAPALRFAVTPGALVAFVDGLRGPQRERVDLRAGDFVLRRGDGVFAYQLAVVVDDLEMGVDHVVRGADLLPSTARQIALARALGGAPPAYLHAPLVVGEDGARLAKRAAGVTVRDHRAAATSPEALVGELARRLGLSGGAPTTPAALLATYDRARLTRGPVRAWGPGAAATRDLTQERAG